MSNQATHPSLHSVFNRWKLVLLLMGFAALGHFNRVGISVAGSEKFISKKVVSESGDVTIIPNRGISETGMGWVYSTLLVCYTIGMLPCGWLVDRYGSARVLTVYGVAMGTFVMLTGSLGWITDSPEGLWVGLLIIRGLAGFCNAPLHPGAAHVVSDLMSDRRRASANGMITAGALIGVACCYPVFGWLMDHLNWPLAFVISGAALIGYALLWQCFATPLLPGPHSADSQSHEHMDLAAVLRLLSQLNLWLISLSYAAYGYFQYLFFYWMGYYFEKQLKLPDIASRQASFYILLAMGAGMFIGGLSTDAICKVLGTIRGRRTIVITGMGLGALFGLIGVNVEGQWNVTVCLAISMGALGMCEGVFWTTATDIGGKSRGFSGAFMNTGGNVGGFISPVLTPFMAETMGWPGAIAVACVISGLGGLVWFLIKPSGNRLTYETDASVVTV